MSWTKYEKTKHLKSIKPQIRIRKDGNCFISRAAYDKHFEGNTGVVLFHDEVGGKIGFQPSNSEEDFVRKLRPVKSKGGGIYGARLSAKSFLEETGVMVNKVFDIEEEVLNDKPLIVIDLESGVEIVPAKRKKATAEEPEKQEDQENVDPA